MAGKPLTIDQVLTLLAETPRRIAVTTAGVSAVLLRTTPEPNEWSATEVLAHLRACADVWGTCIATIIAEDRPTLRALNPRTWITQTDYREPYTSMAQKIQSLMPALAPVGGVR